MKSEINNILKMMHIAAAFSNNITELEDNTIKIAELSIKLATQDLKGYYPRIQSINQD